MTTDDFTGALHADADGRYTTPGLRGVFAEGAYWARAHLAAHDARVRRDAAREALDQAEHRIARLEAQTSIRGRAVVMYRERAREAEERIKAVRDVHTGTAWPGVADKPICDACDQMWPCPTIRALDN